MPVEGHVLFVRPIHDLTTSVLGEKLAPHAIAYAKGHFYTVYDLYNGHANRVEYEANIPLRKPLIVFTFSHGAEDAVIGDDGVTPFLDVHNTWTAKDRLLCIHACHVGKKLAPASVDTGARAVLAFDETLTITIDAETHEPLEGFREVLIDKPCLLFNGVMVKDVHAETIKEYDRWIDYWDERDPHVADVLRFDRDHFKLYGTGEARITASPWILVGFTDIILIIYTILHFLRVIVRAFRRG